VQFKAPLLEGALALFSPRTLWNFLGEWSEGAQSLIRDGSVDLVVAFAAQRDGKG
jgi:hypothetical protein